MENAYVLISCEINSEDNIISQLKSLETVSNAFGTFGTYDIIASIETSDDEELVNTITKQIRKIQRIRGTLTLRTNPSGRIFGRKLTDEELESLEKYSVQAYIIMHCKKSNENEIIEEMNKIPEIIDGNTVIGSYEMICRVIAPTYNDISEIVTKKIRKIKGIKATVTLNIIPEQGNYVYETAQQK